MKVIFLDVDGVLNNWEGLSQYGIHYIDSDKVSLLKSIVYATDAKIVLSSTWRIRKEDFDMVKAVLLSQGMEIYDVTPQTFSAHRGREIGLWLEEKAVLPVDKYAILDDDILASVSREHSYFQTDMIEGLNPEIAENVIHHLNSTEKPKKRTRKK
jgi:hypothetical protein